MSNGLPPIRCSRLFASIRGSTPGFASSFFGMPSMFHTSLSESLITSPTGAKVSEAQGRGREAASERSADAKSRVDEQEPSIRREGRTSGPMAAKSTPVKARQRRDGDRARKGVGLIWGDLSGAPARAGAERAARRADHRAEVSTGRSSDEGRETGWSEGPHGAPEWARTRSGRVNGTLP